MKFPFYQYTDEELENFITKRDFDIHIMTMGMTLVELEQEKQQRSVKH